MHQYSILKQNPYKNEATKSMDNPVVNFKDVSGTVIISQDGIQANYFYRFENDIHRFSG